MGSLDIRSAKRQFFMLVDSVNSSHLPSFAIWLDAKMAEYKTNGLLKPDDDEKENQPYPEWISKSLRNNLSFIFQGDNQSAVAGQNSSSESMNTLQNSQSVVSNRTPVKRKLDSDNYHGGKRPSISDRSTSSDSTHFTVTAEACDDTGPQLPDTVVIKEEHQSEDEGSKLAGLSQAVLPRPDNTVTPMPFVQDTFSVRSNPTASLPNYPSGSSVGNIASGNASTFVGADPSLHSPMQASSLAYNEGLQNPLGFNMHHQQQLTSPSVKSKEQFTPVAGSPSFVPPSRAFDGPGLRPGATAATFPEVPPPPRPPFETRSERPSEVPSTKKRRFVCDLCDKRFRTRTDLTRHLRYHSGERPYKCPYCEVRFTESGNCYQHQRLKHREQPVLKLQT